MRSIHPTATKAQPKDPTIGALAAAAGKLPKPVSWKTMLKPAREDRLRKFKEIDVDEIHVLTDHGFLLLDDVLEEDKGFFASAL